MKILGIDEAGRGCVMGPMVVGGVAVDEKGLMELVGLGVKDSKKLSPKRREELAVGIKKIALGYELRRVEPARIDKTSLNLLDIEEIVFLIGKFSPDKVYFDVPTHPGGVGRFVEAVQRRLNLRSGVACRALGVGDACVAATGADIELVGENHADEKYPVVAAASILAKVERDRIIAKLCNEYGDFGSGYPSDPRTQRFLRDWFSKYHDFPPIVRKKWGTVRRLVEEQ